MRLIKVEIPKSELLLIPESERSFFVQLTNLLDDLITLRKLIYFSSSPEEPDDIIRKALNSQALFLLRLQAGKLSEGWELLRTHFFIPKLSQEYEKRLSSEGQDCLVKIKRYFNGENLVSLIRNEFAFHYSLESSKKMNDLINQAPEKEVFELFLSEHSGNCFCYMPQVLINFAILRLTNSSSYREAMDKLLKEVHDVTFWFLGFLGACITIILEKYEHLGINKNYIEIPDPPRIDKVILPYFTSV